MYNLFYKYIYRYLLLGIIIYMSLNMVGCVSTEQLEDPTNLTKDIKIESSNINLSEFSDIDQIKSILVQKLVIPDSRETKDFIDPFVLKSLKALQVKNNLNNLSKEETDNKNTDNTNQNQQDQANRDDQQSNQKPVDLATESITMFSYEGLLVSNDTKRAILRHISTNKSYIVSIGTVVGGYKIIDIEEDNLVLIMGKEKLVINKNKK